MLIAILIAGGLFLLLPAKIYLALVVMQNNDEKKRTMYMNTKSVGR